MRRRVVIFGATGSIGQAISEKFTAETWAVTKVSRSLDSSKQDGWETVSIDEVGNISQWTLPEESVHAVIWAQGRNATDNLINVDPEQHLDIYRANCLYVISTLKELLTRRLLCSNARLCVISSIWQQIARQNKLSYCVSKSALQGLVLSASVDLGTLGHLINAVLPGPLDTPMTRANLTEKQLAKLSAGTGFDRLPSLRDLCELVLFLCSEQNTSITGQFINVDLGFSHGRIV